MRRIDILGLIFPVGFILAGSACMERRLGRFGGKPFKGQNTEESTITRSPSKEMPESGYPTGNLN